MNRAVFLDRDGVLNRAILRAGKSYPPASLDQLEILPGVVCACASLRAAGFCLIVVTNQPDVARGTAKKEDIEQINQALRECLPLNDIRVCYHDDEDKCTCRKPAAGLIMQAATDWGINLQESFMVGDRPKDIAAGLSAGCRTVLIGHAEESAAVGYSAHHCAESLGEGTQWILEQINASREGR